ncbi:heme A synthase [Planctomycetota bacterium]|nr:heme A synthase [Planctomycetota bacterium]
MAGSLDASVLGRPDGGTAPALPGIASWLGLLLVLVISLNSLGGWVRLSGSGVAIPSWPAIPLGEGRWTLWPPLSAAGWEQVQSAYEADQIRLRQRVEAGELRAGNLGYQAQEPGEFRRLFLTEWSHRLLAAIVGLITAGCLTAVLRSAELRQRIGLPLGLAAGLIVLQAVIGGVLVREGTSTNWLFLHQGNAGAIVACLVWASLRLVASAVPAPDAGIRARRRWAEVAALGAIVVCWSQMILGALLAGSRHGQPFATDFPTLFGQWLPTLWDSGRTVAANILDFSVLHQFVHRWLACALVAACVTAWWLAVRAGAGERVRLAYAVGGTFLGIAGVLGLGNVVLGSPTGDVPPAVALAHQLSATCLLACLTMGWFWLRHEGDARKEANS